MKPVTIFRLNLAAAILNVVAVVLHVYFGNYKLMGFNLFCACLSLFAIWSIWRENRP